MAFPNQPFLVKRPGTSSGLDIDISATTNIINKRIQKIASNTRIFENISSHSFRRGYGKELCYFPEDIASPAPVSRAKAGLRLKFSTEDVGTTEKYTSVPVASTLLARASLGFFTSRQKLRVTDGFSAFRTARSTREEVDRMLPAAQAEKELDDRFQKTCCCSERDTMQAPEDVSPEAAGRDACWSFLLQATQKHLDNV